MQRAGHLSVQQGRRVLVIMRSGDHIKAKFKERKGRYIHFYDHDSITTAEIRTISLYKQLAE